MRQDDAPVLPINALHHTGGLMCLLALLRIGARHDVLTCPLNYGSVLGGALFNLIHAVEMGRSTHHV